MEKIVLDMFLVYYHKDGWQFINRNIRTKP